MTPEFGAASQLEKIDMLDFADFVAINKFDRKGAADALRDVRKQYQRNRELFAQAPDTMPVFGTIAARFNDDGVTALYQALGERLTQEGLKLGPRQACRGSRRARSTAQNVIVPPARVRYLADIAETVRGYHAWAREQAKDRARAAAAEGGAGDGGREPALQGAAGGQRACVGRRSGPTAHGHHHEHRAHARRAHRRARKTPGPTGAQTPRHVAADQGGVHRRRIRRENPRQGNSLRADHDLALRHARTQGRAAEDTRTTAKSCAGS